MRLKPTQQLQWDEKRTAGDTTQAQERGPTMARVMVVPNFSQTPNSSTVVLMDEYVEPEHLDNEHSSLQFIERIAWAVRDAQMHEVGPQLT
jgi:hypothetical protein